MDDDPAVLYLRRDGVQYRIKAFPLTLWIERQPGGDNLPYFLSDHPVYDGSNWDFDAIDALVRLYKVDTQIDAQRPASGGKSSRCKRVGRMSR